MNLRHKRGQSEDFDHDLRAKILTDIKNHLQTHGAQDWHLVRNKYPEIIGEGPTQDRRFFRWVASVKKNTADSPWMKKHAEVSAVKESQSYVTSNLPAPPPPEYIARQGTKNIDFLAQINVIWEDVMRLREWAITENGDGSIRIKNPVFYDLSVRRRLDVLDSALKITQEIWDLQRMESFYDAIVNIIVNHVGPEYPDIQRAIMVELKALNDRRIMTPAADPRAV